MSKSPKSQTMPRFRRSMEKTPEFQHGIRQGEKIARNQVRGWLLEKASELRAKRRIEDSRLVALLAQEVFHGKEKGAVMIAKYEESHNAAKAAVEGGAK